jgi:hypothetical protein
LKDGKLEYMNKKKAVITPPFLKYCLAGYSSCFSLANATISILSANAARIGTVLPFPLYCPTI